MSLSFFIHKMVPLVMCVWDFVRCGTDEKHQVFSMALDRQ